MAKFAQMEVELKNQEESHKDVIYNLERKQVVDKDRSEFHIGFLTDTEILKPTKVLEVGIYFRLWTTRTT